MNFYTLLKFHKRIKSRKLKLIGLFGASRFGFRHLSVRLDPVLGCNLACRMCVFSSPEFRKANKGILSLEELEDIARVLFPRAFQLIVGCGAEPTMHPGYLDLFRLARKYKVPDIGVVSNGQVFKEHDLQVMRELGVNEIILSMHGVRKSTYEKFMIGASYEKLHEVLNIFEEFISENLVLPLTEEAAKYSAEIYANLRQSGNTVDDIDLLIAGIAIENEMILVTNNDSHFGRIPGLKTENWKKFAL